MAHESIKIRHAGPLTLSSFGNALPVGLFRPASKVSESDSDVPDIYHLGWECVPSTQRFVLELKNMWFATAEGVATLAAVTDCLRNIADSSVGIQTDDRNDDWNQALGLERITSGKWPEALNDFTAKLHDCYAHPVWRANLASRETTGELSTYITGILDDITDELPREFRNELAASLEMVARETLLNVFEHAYPNSTTRYVFGSLTVTPVPQRRHLGSLAYATPEELKWFEAYRTSGKILELAIADYGSTIPYTLWADFHSNHPSFFSDIIKNHLGTKEGRRARAELHQHIALWAFSHISSRKKPRDFVDERAQYNWRGLSRILNGASRLNACIVVRSGQARAGYAFTNQSGTTLSVAHEMHKEFPGTALIFRFPLRAPRRGSRAKTTRSKRALSIADLVTKDRIEEISPSIGKSAEASISGVIYAFETLRHEDMSFFLSRTRTASPQKIQLHLFCQPDRVTSLDDLRVFTSHLTHLDYGVPRLVGFWVPDQRIIWHFVGAMAENVRRLIEQLELAGTAYFDEGSFAHAFADQLARVYGEFFHVKEGCISLVLHDCQLDAGTADRALAAAFDLWLKTGQEGWIFEDPSQVYRLPTGRLVRRFASVFKLLLSNDMLAQAISDKLRHELLARQLSRSKPIIILAHSEASYFVARMLLKDRQLHVEIYVRKLPDGVPTDTPLFVFADAIYKGETLTRILRSSPSYSEIFCVLNLWPLNEVSQLKTAESAQLVSLLRFPFDPVEISSDEANLRKLKELEVDAVTHIPEEGPRSERIRIGTTPDRDVFVDSSQGILRHGVHWANAKVHTVSLSVTGLIQQYRATVLDWLSEAAMEFVQSYTGTSATLDLVIFSRYEASVGRIVPDFCGRLKEFGKNRIRRVFSVVLPFAPAEPREVFGRMSGDLLTGVAEALPDRLQLTIEAPSRFIALFLDDHCVTGNSLRSFLIRALMSKVGRAPEAILAITVVSRLSPGEEFFLSSLCSHLSSPAHLEAKVPFRFHCLFRLQVRSADAIQSTLAYGFFTRCFTSSSKLMNERMARYLNEVRSSLEAVTQGEGASRMAIVRHPFFRGKFLGERSVSPRVVRIRHLIALHQQNVGVLGELLREGYKAFDGTEYDLLTLFALEPALLGTPALQKAWGHDLAYLSFKCLSGANHLAIKSDALTVLALTSDDLLGRLVQLLPYLCVDDDLVDQLLVLLITVAPNEGHWAEGLLSAIDRCGSSIAGEHRSYLRSCATSIAQLDEQIGVKTEEDAEAAIDKFIGGLSFHGRWLQPLTLVDDWLSQRESERSASETEKVSEKVKNAASVIRQIVLPAVEGLRLIAKVRDEIPSASILEKARVDLIYNLNLLTEFVDSIGSGPVGRWVSQSIENLWSNIRESTFKTSPDVFLRTLQDSEGAGTLGRIMQSMFSSPTDIVRHLVREQLPGAEVVADWEGQDASPSIVVTPYPVATIIQISRLLIQDMSQHGVARSGVIRFSLEEIAGRAVLLARFKNLVRPNDLRRGGKSQGRVQALAGERGISMKFDEPRRTGEDYEVVAEFHGARYISGE